MMALISLWIAGLLIKNVVTSCGTKICSKIVRKSSEIELEVAHYARDLASLGLM